MASTEESVKFIPATSLESSEFYPGYNPGTEVFPKGSIFKNGHLPLPCDIFRERDIQVNTRDGVHLYLDVYRPPDDATAATLPTILVFTPYGKQGGPNRYNFDRLPWRCGVPRKMVSGLEVFEGPDPAYWCFHGYAIVCADMRGTWYSDGNFTLPCEQQGRDGYDVIEWIAKQPWSNGCVSMAGNSFLAATQWFVAAENPPHLSCIAPWEGFSDLYNDLVQRGGIPDAGNREGSLRGDIAGKAMVEDIFTMTNSNPYWNSYWENRCAKFANIKVPLYVVASWTNMNHTRGTLRAYVESHSKDKWLRVHNSHEWPDLYQPQNVESLRAFFDFYTKKVKNDWIFTPRVRLSVLDSIGQDIINRPETDYPLKRQSPLKLFLDAASGTLQRENPKDSSQCTYSASNGSTTFDYEISEPMEFIGPSNLLLNLEAVGSNDMDIYVMLERCNSLGEPQKSMVIDVGWLTNDPTSERQKLIRENKENPHFCANFFSNGPVGFLRVSHRALDSEKSTTFQPVYTHKEEQLLKPGEIVSANVEIWPYGWRFDAGDKLRVTVSSSRLGQTHFRPTDRAPIYRNQGQHVIHTGGDRGSYLLLPLTSSSS